MMNRLSLLLGLLLAMATMGERTQAPNEYIIVFPESKMITLGQDLTDTESSIEYGKFQCAVRANVLPLWIINGVSAASIKTEVGFEDVNYTSHPLPQNGTFSLLYVPGFVETNNSIIRCGAVVDGEVVAYSQPVNFTVYCDWNCSVNADNESSIVTTDLQTTTVSTTGSQGLPTDKGAPSTSIAPHLIAGISVVVILGVLLMMVATALLVVLGVCVRRRKRASGQIVSNGTADGNVYWSSSGRNLLEESITSQNLKSAP